MHLLRIEAHNFRNLTGAIEFSPGLNVIYGQNAQGKSNWLEASYLLATTKSFRTSHPRDVIKHQAPEALIRGTVIRGNLTKDLQLLITPTTKQTFINGKTRFNCPTWDAKKGSFVMFKWGVYRSGTMNGKGAASTYMSGAKIGNTFADVAP